MTRSPSFQSPGVPSSVSSVRRSERTTRSTSWKSRPVVAGYRIVARMVLSGAMKKSARAGMGTPAASRSFGSNMPRQTAISRLSSEISGKSSTPPSASCKARTSADHARCSATGSQLRPISFTPSSRNCAAMAWQMPSSVVQTGVKSFGCEKRMVHAGSRARKSWNAKSPCVVLHSKSGRAAPILIPKSWERTRGGHGAASGAGGASAWQGQST
mmetsp:Transcript_30595/g.90817  ORF Transcript_30595/g.90817 Transcript_30595/m.90817 type:complete len:214 (+) Transcript_30595:233-874(+)